MKLKITKKIEIPKPILYSKDFLNGKLYKQKEVNIILNCNIEHEDKMPLIDRITIFKDIIHAINKINLKDTQIKFTYE